MAQQQQKTNSTFNSTNGTMIYEHTNTSTHPAAL